MDRDNGEIYDVCTGRDATALRAVMIEPCTEKKKTCLQNVELPLSVAIISVRLTQALMRRVILEKINRQRARKKTNTSNKKKLKKLIMRWVRICGAFKD